MKGKKIIFLMRLYILSLVFTQNARGRSRRVSVVELNHDVRVLRCTPERVPLLVILQFRVEGSERAVFVGYGGELAGGQVRCVHRPRRGSGADLFSGQDAVVQLDLVQDPVHGIEGGVLIIMYTEKITGMRVMIGFIS